jgi:hypothetical protein
MGFLANWRSKATQANDRKINRLRAGDAMRKGRGVGLAYGCSSMAVLAEQFLSKIAMKSTRRLRPPACLRDMARRP